MPETFAILARSKQLFLLHPASQALMLIASILLLLLVADSLTHIFPEYPVRFDSLICSPNIRC